MNKRFILLALSAVSVFCATAYAAKIVAHRGYWKTEGSAQNSISSLANAAGCGAYASEFDVWLTADSCLVVNHDAKFKDVDIENATLEQVRAITLDNGEILPTLDEYLAEAKKYPNLKLVLELKTLHNRDREAYAACKVHDMTAAHGLAERTDYISFSLNACMTFKQSSPTAKVYYLNGDIAPENIKTIGLDGIDYSMRALRQHPDWIRRAKDIGLEVNVWTVDADEDIKYFENQDVDYITTNRPVEALGITAEK